MDYAAGCNQEPVQAIVAQVVSRYSGIYVGALVQMINGTTMLALLVGNITRSVHLELVI